MARAPPKLGKREHPPNQGGLHGEKGLPWYLSARGWLHGEEGLYGT